MLKVYYLLAGGTVMVYLYICSIFNVKYSTVNGCLVERIQCLYDKHGLASEITFMEISTTEGKGRPS